MPADIGFPAAGPDRSLVILGEFILDIQPRTEARGVQRGTAGQSRLPAGNVSPTERGSGEAIPGSCAIRRPRERCDVFGVHESEALVQPIRTLCVLRTSVWTRYPRAPCILFVSERPRGCPRSQVSSRPGTARAIGLPALRATMGRHKRARVAFCLSCRHGLGDALSGTVWWPSSPGRTPIHPPVFACCAYLQIRCRED